MTIRSLFSLVPLEPPELRILLEHALGFSRVKLITHSDHVLTDAEANAVSDVLARRLRGEPVAYITGIREFYGLPFAVTPDVLIPRPETELLVDLALARLPEGGRVVDLGTGSGAIAVAIAAMRPDAQVWATDISGKALDIARKNAASCLKNGQSVRFRQGNWYEALEPGSRFDLIVSNPPYIHSADEHLRKGDLRFEPLSALTDYTDGLSAMDILIDQAPAYLKKGGELLMEHGYNQSGAVRKKLVDKKYLQVQSWKDLAGIERVSGGRLPD
nr:peptide chain release factor N(5)-glutamine methyltransferase [Oxalobacter paraformigenes]